MRVYILGEAYEVPSHIWDDEQLNASVVELNEKADQHKEMYPFLGNKGYLLLTTLYLLSPQKQNNKNLFEDLKGKLGGLFEVEEDDLEDEDPEFLEVRGSLLDNFKRVWNRKVRKIARFLEFHK